MSNRLHFYLLAVLAVCILPCTAQNDAEKKVDPNMTEFGGYGYLVDNSSTARVWWAEGAYKVMRDAPVPTRKKDCVELSAARNEYESFLVVVNPSKRLREVRVNVSDFKRSDGASAVQPKVTVRKVEYVNVTTPTDNYAFAGSWPDPLPLYDSPETIYPDENQPFWITVKTPKDFPAGMYSSTVSLSDADGWSVELPIKLNVRNFALPQTPSVRSGFGMNLQMIAQYGNLKTPEQKEQAFEYYMQAFRDYKISPYDPFVYSPIVEKIDGVAWNGGLFDSKHAHSGTYSYMVVDNSPTSNIEAATRNLIPVKSGMKYKLQWFACSKEAKQSYVIGVEFYDNAGKLLPYNSKFDQFNATSDWSEFTYDLGTVAPQAASAKIRLFGAMRTAAGESTGTMWFDDLQLVNQSSGHNEFAEGNFEIDLNKINIKLDFTDFKAAAHRYFDEYGFTAFNLRLKGLGGGTYYSHNGGVFEGFVQGSDEYMKLMKQYLGQIQDNLESCRLLDKAYIYWFDEPLDADYAFVYDTHKMIKSLAPKLRTFLTEHIAGHDISDVTDISCTIWHKLNHEKISKMNAQPGKEYWSYVCTGPKSPWITEFIDHDAINMRMWLWGSYVYKLKGILIWETTYWNSVEASPVGYLQNPWDEAMSFTTSYGLPQGKQACWGNGDGRLFYPTNRDPNGDNRIYLAPPVPSLRLEFMRDGIEDYEYLAMLESLINKAPKSKAKLAAQARQLLTIPQSIYTDEKTYTKDPQKILEYRLRLADCIEQLQR